MANQTYFCTLTAIGEAKDANAKALGTALKLTEMAVGDGNGTLPTPDRTRTALVRQVRRAPLNTLKPDPQNPGQLIAEQIIPEDVGGWWIRELGIYDDAGDLIAIGNCPETYKPQLAEGSGRVQVVRMVLIMSSAATVQLKIDPSVVLATRKYADDQDAAARQAATDQLAAHGTAQDPHPQYMTDAKTATKIAAAIAGKADLAGAVFTGPIYTSSKVGIGTDTPLTKLHVNDNLTVTSGGNVTGAGGSIFFSALPWTTSPMATIKSLLSYAGGNEEQGSLAFHTRPTINGPGAALTERMRLSASGNVGINTTDPQARLHVNGRAILGVLGVAGQNALTLNPDTPGNSVFHVKVGAGADALTISTGSDAYGSTERVKVSGLGDLTLAGEIAVNGAASIVKIAAGGAYNNITQAGDAMFKGTSTSIPVVSGMHNGAAIRFGASTMQFRTGNSASDMMQLDGSGNLLVGVSSGATHNIRKNVAEGAMVLSVGGLGAGGLYVLRADQAGYNASAAAVLVDKFSGNGRSINAGGTINATGADYAEYMAKAAECGVIKAGQIAGINAAGQVVDTWPDAVSFLIKSTNPSYVGGDTWGSADALGIHRPDVPVLQIPDYAGEIDPGEEPKAPIEPAAPVEPAEIAAPIESPAPVAPVDASDEEKVAYAVLQIQHQEAITAQAAAYHDAIKAQAEQYQADLARHATLMALYQDELEKYQQDKAAYDMALVAYHADQAAYAAKVENERLYFDAITMPAYEADLAKFKQVLEQARQRVDRMAYCGQVPVNVTGAKPGQYVVPVQAGEGIAGQLVDADAITFDQYRRAVGIVQNILPDGRANVRVKPV